MLNYEKCESCGSKEGFVFIPPGNGNFSGAQCRACKQPVPPSACVDFELHELPTEMLNKIDFMQKNSLWTWGTGGFPLSDNDHSIGYLAGPNGDGPECRFRMPDAISYMLRREHEQGEMKARSEIKRALRI